MRINKMEIAGEEQFVCDSIDVAKAYGKRHSAVLKNIQELNCNEEFRRKNFAEIEAQDSDGVLQTAIMMTRSGYALLAREYTGRFAQNIKRQYLRCFDEAEDGVREESREHEERAIIHQLFRKTLRKSRENNRLAPYTGAIYTNCIYRTLFGMDTKQLRARLCIEKEEPVREHLTEEELMTIAAIECLMIGLLECGWDYDEIKDFISENAHSKQFVI